MAVLSLFGCGSTERAPDDAESAAQGDAQWTSSRPRDSEGDSGVAGNSGDSEDSRSDDSVDAIGGDSGVAGNSGDSVGSGSDASVDAIEADVASPDPTAMEFRLENSTNRTVYIQPISSCKHNPTDWVQFGDRQPDGSIRRRLMQLSCTACTCSAVEDGYCGVCGGCGKSNLEKLEPGESVSRAWTGYFYTEDTVDGQECTRQYVPAEGTELGAKFCWVTPTENGDAPEDAESHLECRRETFSYGNVETVAAEVSRP